MQFKDNASATYSKKKWRKFLFFLLCSGVSFWGSISAQSPYYHFNGKKIPLSVSKEKICILTPKVHESTSQKLQNAVFESEISNDDFIIHVVDMKDTSAYYASYYGNADAGRKEKSDLRNAIALPVYHDRFGMDLVLANLLKVRLKSVSDTSLLQEECQRYKLEIKESSAWLPLWYVLSITPETRMNTLDVANRLHESGLFLAACPEFFCKNTVECVSEPDFDLQWNLSNEMHPGIDISICQAWEISQGRGVNIAIVDGGIDKEHIDLKDNIHPMSFDAMTQTSPSKQYSSHGTHCAGIAAAPINGRMIAGVAPQAKLMDVSAFPLETQYSSGIRYAIAISWAWKNGADILSCSWHTNNDEAVKEAIDSALQYGRHGKGTIIVKSAGNDSTKGVSFPGNYRPEVLTVGSISQQGIIAPSSSIGDEVDVCAPGVNILSTYPDGILNLNSGTSMACPHVSGIAALLLSVRPDLTGQQVRDIIEQTAKKIGDTSYAYHPERSNGTWNRKYGYGLVDAAAAVRKACPVTSFTDRTVTEDIQVEGCHVETGDISVENGASVLIEAGSSATITGKIKVKDGSFTIK